MTAASRYAPGQPGPVSKAVIRLLMKHAAVVRNEHICDGFHLLALEGQALKDVAWLPGQKVQIPIGSAFVTRTYTPINWDASAGRTQIIGYAHGVGPGSDWVRNVGPGDGCDIFGPRASLDMTRLSGPIALFGDETSFGLAVAGAVQLRAVRCLFEVKDFRVARAVAERIGLGDPILVERRAEDSHLVGVERQLVDLAATETSFVLTGKASSIQRLRQGLKAIGVAPARIITKAYWAAGKSGLD